MHKKDQIRTAFPNCLLASQLDWGRFPEYRRLATCIFLPGDKPTMKQSEQTEGQQLLKQLKDEYRRPEGHNTEAAVEEHATGSLPDPQYWPAEISRAIN